jgi:baculoviral IAP repeat-containing protein 6
MPPHKFKDPFHKFKATLSKYLDHSSSSKSTPSMATTSFFGLGKRSGPPSTSETTSQTCIGGLSSQRMFPQELAPDLASFNNIFARIHMQCRSCHAPLSLEIDAHLATWLTGAQVIPPTSQISVLQCTKCDQLTCVGCGGEPKVNKHNVFTTLGVVNHCCYEGRLFGVWLLLARFDKAEYVFLCSSECLGSLDTSREVEY